MKRILEEMISNIPEDNDDLRKQLSNILSRLYYLEKPEVTRLFELLLELQQSLRIIQVRI